MNILAINNQDVRNILTTALRWDLIAQKLNQLNETDHSVNLSLTSVTSLRSEIFVKLLQYDEIVGNVRTPEWLEEMVSIVNTFCGHAFQNVVGLENWGNHIDRVVGDPEELMRELEGGEVKGLDY